MEISNFFDFSSKLVSSTVQAHAVGLRVKEGGVKDRLNLIKGNYENINFPVLSNKTLEKKLQIFWIRDG